MSNETPGALDRLCGIDIDPTSIVADQLREIESANRALQADMRAAMQSIRNAGRADEAVAWLKRFTEACIGWAAEDICPTPEVVLAVAMDMAGQTGADFDAQIVIRRAKG